MSIHRAGQCESERGMHDFGDADSSGICSTVTTIDTLPLRRAIPDSKRAESLLALTEDELARTDPLELNLLVAKGIPSLADLDVADYQRRLDCWANDIRQRLPYAELVFWQSPQDWKDDVNLFRLGVLCEYLDRDLGIRYVDEGRNSRSVRYVDPSDLFLNGVIDSRQGTCGNMAALHVALGWRLGWPVSLACVGSHFICRYDDGRVVHNIKATQTGDGGFSSRTDAQYMEEFNVSPKAVRVGSDLTALTARQTLGSFFGLRARHHRDTSLFHQADEDYALARWLFPQNQYLWCCGTEVALNRKPELFDPPGPMLVLE